MSKPRRRGSPTPRHLALNRARGDRARAHLERARERDRKRLRSAGRARERARTSGDFLHRRTLRRGLIFLGSLAAGILLVSPLQHQLTRISGVGLGTVETIAIQGNAHLSFEDVAEATGVAPGRPLAEVDIAAVTERLQSEGWIREAQVLVLPPSTLLVRVEERQPRAVLFDGTNRILGEDDARATVGRLIDATGTPFAPLRGRRPVLSADALPRIVGGRTLASDHSHESLVTALALLERFQEPADPALAALGEGIRLHLPERTAEGWILEVPDRTLRVVLGRDHLFERFDRLAELLRARLPALARPVRIDLRFADQAVLQELTASG